MAKLYANSIILTIIEKTNIPIVIKLKVDAAFSIIFSTEDFTNSMPSIMIINDIIIAARYSARACPKGCFLSAGLSAILKLTKLTAEDAVSEILFKPSLATEILLKIKPTTSFKTPIRQFAIIPTKLAIAPIKLRSLASVCFSSGCFFMIFFAIKTDITNPPL